MDVKTEETNKQALDNVVSLHGTEELVLTNVVAFRRHYEMHVVAEDNVVALETVSEALAPSADSLTPASACANGVCSISWKPQKPSAA